MLRVSLKTISSKYAKNSLSHIRDHFLSRGSLSQKSLWYFSFDYSFTAPL